MNSAAIMPIAPRRILSPNGSLDGGWNFATVTKLTTGVTFRSSIQCMFGFGNLASPIPSQPHNAMFVRPLHLIAAGWLAVSAVGSAAAAQTGRHPETIRAGTLAPDFTLASPDGKQSVTLSDFRGKKPVVLIFGSYTCPPFRDVYPTLERLHRQYGSEVAFFYVYIREAHPEDGWKMPRNQRDGIMIQDPKSMNERTEVARQACAFFKTNIPALVDTMDDSTDRAYAGWPSRIFLVDSAGKVAVRGEPGPRGLVPAARKVDAWLQEHHGSRKAEAAR